ncbi:MAG: hypothetical protein ABI954_09770 [Pyrinomonadaceae bacterium]
MTLTAIWDDVPFLFRKTLKPEETIDKVTELDRKENHFERIRCPLCQWEPQSADRWTCADGGHPEYYYGACYTSWNTFATRGMCPGCHHQWRWTTCLRCHDFSLHEDWYTTSEAE